MKALYVRFMNEMGEAGKWDMKAMKMERRELLRRRAIENEMSKRSESGDVVRKMETEAPLLKKIQSMRKAKAVVPSVRERRRGRFGGTPLLKGRGNDGSLSGLKAVRRGSTLREQE